MNRFVPRIAAAATLVPVALAFACALVSCSGAVGPSTQVNDPTKITVQPSPAVAFSGLPTTLVITGGTGSYVVSSDNQAVIPVAGSITGGSLTFFPNPVLADTTVTITVRDTGTAPVVNATVTVRPGTVANDITITPSSTQGTGCDPGLCSGGDALVTATISQGGIPLAARGVIFQVVSGDFRFITSQPGASIETLDTQTTVFTDQTGQASARIRALPGAANQTALLQVTDQGTGAYRRASFAIAQATGSSPGFFITPDSVVFQGPRADQCAAGGGLSANFFVFGGTPPYTVSNSSSAFFLPRTTVASSGGSFEVVPNGICVDKPGLPVVVTDSAGHTVSALVANIPGTTAVPPLVAGPDTLTLSSCSSVASFTAAGGTGNYLASSGSGSVMVTASTNGLFTVQRVVPSAAVPTTTPPATVNVAVTDGTSTATVKVNLTGNAAGACPTPFSVTPSSVTLVCGTPASVTASGGTGTYTATSSTASVSATVSGATITIQRPSPSAAYTPPATVTIKDANDPSVSTNVQINGVTTACP